MRAIALGIALALLGSQAWALQLTSANVVEGGSLALAQVHRRCGGGNQSPALSWSGAPSGTRSFALTLFDPDAGGGSGFWHWLVVDLPAGSSALPAGAGSGDGLPTGSVQRENDFGDAGYGGACPPSGSGLHHYRFTLYALDVSEVPVKAGTSGTDLNDYLKAHALATATLVGLYQR
jgi:Raf kinase inhibitor-like YbhB/YbcL family protein